MRAGEGRLRQGDLMTLWLEKRNIEPILSWENQLYRAARYAPDYPGLQGLDLTPKGTIEIYPEP